VSSKAGRAILVGAVATALAVAGLAPAGAKQKTNRFSGSCSFPGTVYFTPPAKNSDQNLDVLFKATGKCSGTLNGKKISDATTKARHTAKAFGGCGGAHTVKTGSGTLTFPDGTVVGYLFNFTSMGTEVTFTFHGMDDGDGSGHGSFATQRTGPDVVINCAGDGTPTAPLDLTLQTESTFVSTRTVPNGPKPKRRPHLRMRVRPTKSDTGERTTFKFRVRSKGRAVRRATVRFAGERVKTNRRGKARLSLTLHRRGKHTARASKRGYVSARRAVRAR
jgi:hypothetical protein